MLIHFDETQLGRLGRFIIDCQSKFISVHGDLNNRFHKFGDTFEADIYISRNVNSKILGKSLNVEKLCFADEQTSVRECLKISGVPQIVNGN